MWHGMQIRNTASGARGSDHGSNVVLTGSTIWYTYTTYIVHCPVQRMFLHECNVTLNDTPCLVSLLMMFCHRYQSSHTAFNKVLSVADRFLLQLLLLLLA